MLKTLLALLAVTLAAACTPLASAPATAPTPATTASAPPLTRGINILGYDPIWQDPARARFQQRHFRAIREGGFDFVRVNLHAFKHMNAAGRLSPAFLSRLDWIVSEAGAAGLSVILDEHDFNDCAKDVATCRTRLSAFWSQIGERYSDAPDSVLFELLNEPHDKLDAATWNALFPELLAIVRRNNPTRWVVVGPTRWNNFAELPTLVLPSNDRRILATFHYYDPFRFTHQGTSWTDLKTLSGVTWGSEADRAQLAADFARVAAWSKANDRPVLLGEFGAYDRGTAPLAMRMAYTAAVAREAERHGLPWAYWQFDSDFIAWDMAADRWVDPVHRALVPPAP